MPTWATPQPLYVDVESAVVNERPIFHGQRYCVEYKGAANEAKLLELLEQVKLQRRHLHLHTHCKALCVSLSLTHSSPPRARQPRRARSSSHRTRGGTRYARRQLPTFLSQVRNRATCHLGSPPTLPCACPDPIPCSSCLPFVLFSPPRWSLATWHTRNDARTVST